MYGGRDYRGGHRESREDEEIDLKNASSGRQRIKKVGQLNLGKSPFGTFEKPFFPPDPCTHLLESSSGSESMQADDSTQRRKHSKVKRRLIV